MQFVDTHSHLYLDAFQDDIDTVLERCRTEGITQVVLPNIDTSTISSLENLCSRSPDMFFPLMGLHPCSVGESYRDELVRIREELEKGGYHGIGEIGIDLYWDKQFKAEQIEAFQIQCRWAIELDLPVVIHVRESFETVFEALDEVYKPGLRGIFHCFTGTGEQAQKIMAYGSFMLGIGGVLTFKNSGLDAVVKDIPMEFLVLETDAPYLTPAPFRGKRNESSYTRLIAEKLAEVKDIPVQQVAKVTTHNAQQIFHGLRQS